MTYKVIGNSRRIEKDFLKIINSFTEEEQNTIWQILLNDPKGSGATHWTIKKVHKDIWQLDLPSGYRLESVLSHMKNTVKVEDAEDF
jgi:hypothetical protein